MLLRMLSRPTASTYRPSNQQLSICPRLVQTSIQQTQTKTQQPRLRINTTHSQQNLRYKSTCSSTRKMTSRETLPQTSIRVLRTVEAVRRWRKPLIEQHRSVALVPTMGALHAGHLSLIRAAARENHEVVVSLYVNPAQFGIKEDLSSYPKTWEADAAALRRLDRELADDGGNMGRVSCVFAPGTRDMYPSGFPGQEVDSEGSFVSITPLGEVLEGKTRPTFFRGVATVCMKLFNIVQPSRAYFGQKDVQQTVVVRRMVEDFMMPMEVVVCGTEREGDGLAMSSRNMYLGERRRAVAPVLYKALKAAEKVYLGGVVDGGRILEAAKGLLREQLERQRGMGEEARSEYEVDYISLADPDTMMEVEEVDVRKGAVVSGAIKMLAVGKAREGEDLGHSGGPGVRLIDNIILKPVGE